MALLLLLVVHQKGGDAMASTQSGLTTVAKLIPVLAFALVAASCLEHIVP